MAFSSATKSLLRWRCLGTSKRGTSSGSTTKVLSFGTWNCYYLKYGKKKASISTGMFSFCEAGFSTREYSWVSFGRKSCIFKNWTMTCSRFAPSPLLHLKKYRPHINEPVAFCCALYSRINQKPPRIYVQGSVSCYVYLCCILMPCYLQYPQCQTVTDMTREVADL